MRQTRKKTIRAQGKSNIFCLCEPAERAKQSPRAMHKLLPISLEVASSLPATRGRFLAKTVGGGNQTARGFSRCLEGIGESLLGFCRVDSPAFAKQTHLTSMKLLILGYQRLQPDFFGAGFLAAAFFFAVRLAGLRALFFATLRAGFFLRAVAMIPPSGNADVIIG